MSLIKVDLGFSKGVNLYLSYKNVQVNCSLSRYVAYMWLRLTCIQETRTDKILLLGEEFSQTLLCK